ncbi:MAG TPA: LON peptidase substrate-binding domain-containing protein [Methylophilaceae bacterium]|jgi:Lon protease-like protein
MPLNTAADRRPIPLFPLPTVVFPQGLLPLRIFEVRYLDMVKRCYRDNGEFGVVADIEDADGRFPFCAVGTLVRIVDFDVPEIGLINIRCLAGQRFMVHAAAQQADGLWLGEVTAIADDVEIRIPEDLMRTSQNLRHVIDALLKHGFDEDTLPIARPYRFDDCGWVANRWIELLNLPLIQKQRFLELDSPLLRLELVQDIFIENENKEQE